MKWLVLASLLMAAPALAQESASLNVNQTHTLKWDWEKTEGPVTSFVFKCGQYVKEIVDADVRKISFGSLIDEPGQYSGCTLTARNEAGDSVPVVLPSFDYAYSYGALCRLLLELAATVGAGVSVLAVSARQVLGYFQRRKQTPLALPAPIIILQREHDYVRHL